MFCYYKDKINICICVLQLSNNIADRYVCNIFNIITLSLSKVANNIYLLNNRRRLEKISPLHRYCCCRNCRYIRHHCLCKGKIRKNKYEKKFISKTYFQNVFHASKSFFQIIFYVEVL